MKEDEMDWTWEKSLNIYIKSVVGKLTGINFWWYVLIDLSIILICGLKCLCVGSNRGVSITTNEYVCLNNYLLLQENLLVVHSSLFSTDFHEWSRIVFYNLGWVPSLITGRCSCGCLEVSRVELH